NGECWRRRLRRRAPLARKNAATADACGNARGFSAASAKEQSPRSLRTEGFTARRTVEPCTRHGRRCIAWHRRTLQSDNASYARALDRAHNLTSRVATKSESLPITSRAGNDR